MGNFFGDHLETIMMVAFLIAVALSMYKVYVIFETKAQEGGVNLDSLEEDVIRVFHEIIGDEKECDEKELCQKIKEHKDIQQYKNFNHNRFRLILQKLYDEHKVDSLSELKSKF